LVAIVKAFQLIGIVTKLTTENGHPMFSVFDNLYFKESNNKDEDYW
jgi:hypothetical protein